MLCAPELRPVYQADEYFEVKRCTGVLPVQHKHTRVKLAMGEVVNNARTIFLMSSSTDECFVSFKEISIKSER